LIVVIDSLKTGLVWMAALDTEGMQTMRTLADNLAWMLAKIHAGDNPDYPQHESERQGMNFIR
jgi:hypothetical protein